MAKKRGLSAYSIEDLAEEIRRRGAEVEVGKVPLCDTCAHFEPVPVELSLRQQARWNCCQMGNKMEFRMPADFEEVNSGEFGYYRTGCADRSEHVPPNSDVEIPDPASFPPARRPNWAKDQAGASTTSAVASDEPIE